MPKVALVVDDLETIEPWKPRGIKIHGHAEVGERQGRFGTGLYIAVLPQVAWSWGIEAPVFQDGKPVMKRTVRQHPSRP
jgi:pyridoxamine 5'-phosphate oxidase family protein